jgi:hypothetical protein
MNLAQTMSILSAWAPETFLLKQPQVLFQPRDQDLIGFVLKPVVRFELLTSRTNRNPGLQNETQKRMHSTPSTGFPLFLFLLLYAWKVRRRKGILWLWLSTDAPPSNSLWAFGARFFL